MEWHIVPPLHKNQKYIKKIGIMTINNSFYINKKPNKLMFGLPILKKYVAEYLFWQIQYSIIFQIFKQELDERSFWDG